MFVKEEELPKLEKGDAIDSYFECITSCGLGDGHGDCITQCVEVHLKPNSD